MSMRSAQEYYDYEEPNPDLPPEDEIDDIVESIKDTLEDPEIPTLMRRRLQRDLLRLEY